MYSFGMSNRDIKAHLEKIYNVNVSLDLISRVTNAEIDDVRGMAEPPRNNNITIFFCSVSSACIALSIRTLRGFHDSFFISPSSP